MIGRDLRTIREACGVTMGELADALEWKLTALSDKEREASPLSDAHVAEFVAVLARIVRTRAPVGVIEAPGLTRMGRHPTTGLAMLRILASGERDVASLAAEMRHPRFMVTTLARGYAKQGRVASIRRVPSKHGPPQNVYAITDAGRAYLAKRSDP